MKKYRQLKYEDRIRLESLYLKKVYSKKQLARILHCHRNTITNELKRGMYRHRNSDWTEEWRYSADLAEERYQKNNEKRGTQLKIANDIEYANYIEKKVVEENYSPSAVLGEMIRTGKDKEFQTTICVTTFYSYITKGVFFRLTNKDLPVKKEKKRPYNKVKRQKRVSAGTSISERDDSIENREEFGHWEMDMVVGKKNVSKNVLLVLSERKTREELIFKLPTKEAKGVVEVLDLLESQYGDKFSKIFKTITVDNGTEFSLCEDMEKSLYGGQRTKMYYCHAYSSWERGTNENQNKLVRRKVPKGSDFDHYTEEQVKEIETWMNHYPRKIFNWRTSHDLFSEEIALII